MNTTVISVEHLSKQYDLGVVGTGSLVRDFERWWARMRKQPDPYAVIGHEHHHPKRGESILALDDVSFSVQQGEALGIIGKNGAGKSTLLKILSRVTAPTSGVVKVKGRIGSLLEVGTGFHPELTGRENVYLNGAILGMKKDEVTRKFDEIVDFSGVEKFIDTPVKRYSSGMYVRLAFAVAAHLDPEILIVDEVLAVGDAEFQKKCLGKMGDVAGEGRTVLFVSHNMVAIQNLCHQTILLGQGKVVRIGKSELVVSNYLANSREMNKLYFNENERLGNHRIMIESFSLYPPNPRTGHPLKCVIDIRSEENESITADYSISFKTESGYKIFQLHSGHVRAGIKTRKGRSQVVAEIESLPLTPGKYDINLWIGSGKMTYDWIPEAYSFDVDSGSLVKGIFVDNRGYPIVMSAKWSNNE